ncbi:hypothetical protein TRFO_16495 [Tritrichomonas foetus]|uniref:V-SNARE coiled-coil homology domain-containing protein n=1 Tax=Tritrichomonas foetus TaxID=1144522 RepID=A0A1J4KQM6_9EUKA|nr:hypothetical protein TRFO_16495 [Tritrichomonas foetus]|eukprot:OHT13394.1 hypothetical protein TRFO_16495 [Tritrichomonas foetus]
MLSRLFNQSMPRPSDDMINKHLHCFENKLDSEIISGAYEPRFGLFALGTATGFLYIINNENLVFRSPKNVNYPLLKIIPLPNSSSFLSVCSKTMFERHSSRNKPNKQNSKYFTTLNDVKSSKIQNIITHWIIKPDGILSRTTQMLFDIVDIAISPTYPEFALMLTKEGSLYGFSIESLKYTDLYIDVFEHKPVTSIFCPPGLKYYITHEQINKLDVPNMEIDVEAKISVLSYDAIDQWAAVIDKDGTPKLLMLTNSVSSIDVPKGSKAVFCGMTSAMNWSSIIRSDTGDTIFDGKKEKIKLNNEFLVPNVFIKYGKPFYRSNIEDIIFVTDHGKFIHMNGDVQDHFYTDMGEVKKALVDEDNLYVFTDKYIYRFVKSCLVDRIENHYGIPLFIKNEKMVVVEKNEFVYVYEINSKKRKKLDKLALANIRNYKHFIDFICENGQIFRLNTESSIYSLEELPNKIPKKKIKDWRNYKDTFVGINEKDCFIFGSKEKKVCKDEDEELLLFEMMNENGKPVEGDGFVLIVTSKKICVYEHDKKEKFHKIRKEKLRIQEATISEWGTLILHTEDDIRMLPLPDVSQSVIDKISIPKHGNAILIPHHGAVIWDSDNDQCSFSVIMDETKKPIIYNENSPVLEFPQVNVIQKLLGMKNESIQEVDKTFKYDRPKDAATNLAETNELMQEILVKAQERGEMLNEMEIKAEKILNSAQKFHEIAKSLKKKF